MKRIVFLLVIVFIGQIVLAQELALVRQDKKFGFIAEKWRILFASFFSG